MAKRDDPRQLNLFGPADAVPSVGARAAKHAIDPAPPTPETIALAARMPPHVRLGTSSWSFPGWAGIVYSRPATESALARDGLAAYARHPLLRMVGIDRTFYAPISRDVFARYAADVPVDFRFLCKAYDGVTSPLIRSRGDGGALRMEASPHFLDPAFACAEVVAPFVEGLGEKAGPLVFQFVPMARRTLGSPAKFIDRLAEFLAKLPRGPLYAVEMRNEELLTPQYADALRAVAACHCFNVHPSMPPIERQAEVLGDAAGPAVVVRWMLNRKFQYDEAKSAYAPFDRIVDADLASRAAIAELCGRAAILGKLVFIAANNKAEGSAPRTLYALAEQIVRI